MNLYSLFGLSSTASEHEIRRAWRKLAARHHPDHNPGREHEAKRDFQRLLSAFEILSDSDRRREYDKSLKSPSPPVVVEPVDDLDIFDDIATTELSRNGLNPLWVPILEMGEKCDLVIHNWAGAEPVKPEGLFADGRWHREVFFSWSSAAMTQKQLLKKFNVAFPSAKLKNTAAVCRGLLAAIRMLRRMHDDRAYYDSLLRGSARG